MSEEIWKSVVGFEGFYEVSNLGKIRRIAGKTGTPKSPTPVATRMNRSGYLRANLTAEGSRATRTVHSTVITAFYGNPPSGKDRANHIDGNKINNSISNLEWTDAKGNGIHAKVLGLYNYGDRNGRAKLTWNQVDWIRNNAAEMSQSKMARILGVSSATVREIVIGEAWIIPTAANAMSASEAEIFQQANRNRV